MDSQLKPCPHCGGTDLQVDWNSVYECHFVRCYNCHMQGPESTEGKMQPRHGTPSPAATRSRPTPWTARDARNGATGATPMTDRIIGKRDMAATLGKVLSMAAFILEE